MDWLQVTVLTTTEGADVVSELLMEIGSSGTMIEDRADIAANQRPEGQWDIIDESIALRMSEDVRVSGYYEADKRAQDVLAYIFAKVNALSKREEGAAFGKLEVEVKSLGDEDWAESWKKQYKPFRLGEHVVVQPSWTKADIDRNDKVIQIDPGMAFGTGTHETTGMCVALIEQYVKPGDRVIDVGTGTGILAIAACMMGAQCALATDIDPTAVRVAEENIIINGMQERITARQGDLLKAVGEPDAQNDVIIANIISDVICMIAAPIREYIKPNGYFICSGIAQDKLDKVLGALGEAGYQELDVRQKGEWAAIACKNPG